MADPFDFLNKVPCFVVNGQDNRNVDRFFGPNGIQVAHLRNHPCDIGLERYLPKRKFSPTGFEAARPSRSSGS